MNQAAIRHSERLYSFLVRLYPASYRQEFGEEMEYVFSECLRDAYRQRGAEGIVALWGRTITDAGKSLVTQHLENQKGAPTMKTNKSDILMQNKVILWLALGTALVLLAPFVAMQFTDEVRWSVADFAVMGALLFGTGLMFVLVARMAGNSTYRTAAGIALAAALILVWLSLGVGIIGRDGDLANLIYFGVLAVGITGAALVRFRPAGVARALVATALAQLVVAAVAIVAGWGTTTPYWPFDILGLTAFFTTLWLISAWLFRKAAQQGPEQAAA